MEYIISFFDFSSHNKEWQGYFSLLILLISLFLLGKLLRYIIKRASRKQALIDHPVYASFLEAIANSVTFFLVVVGLALGSGMLVVPEQFIDVVAMIKKVLIVISIGFIVYQLIDVPGVWFETVIDKQEKSTMNKMIIPVIRKTLRLAVIIGVILQIFQMLYDKPIATIIAGLGIGSLAIALAAQDTLKHFIGSFVIAGDKPFEIGQRIAVDGHEGVIESIGLRSANIRTLEGHLVTIPNGILANLTIRNIGQREYIRRVGNITITYDTPIEKIYKSVEIIKEILADHEGMKPELPPRVYFNEFNPHSLNIQFTFWYHPPEYWDFMAFSERVNFEIIRKFNDEQIDFAFPTQTLHLAGDPKRPLQVGVKSE